MPNKTKGCTKGFPKRVSHGKTKTRCLRPGKLNITWKTGDDSNGNSPLGQTHVLSAQNPRSQLCTLGRCPCKIPQKIKCTMATWYIAIFRGMPGVPGRTWFGPPAAPPRLVSSAHLLSAQRRMAPSGGISRPMCSAMPQTSDGVNIEREIHVYIHIYIYNIFRLVGAPASIGAPCVLCGLCFPNLV